MAFQRRQGVNMNLVGPFQGKGYFRLLPAERPATEEDVRRFALHTGESLKERLEDNAAPLILMATHRQGFRQKREVVSLLRRAGYGAIAPEGDGEPQEGGIAVRRGDAEASGLAMQGLPELQQFEYRQPVALLKGCQLRVGMARVRWCGAWRVWGRREAP